MHSMCVSLAGLNICCSKNAVQQGRWLEDGSNTSNAESLTACVQMFYAFFVAKITSGRVSIVDSKVCVRLSSNGNG
jgi:hypothetical protein